MQHALDVLEYDLILARLADHCQSELAMMLAEELRPSFDPAETTTLQQESEEASDLLSLEQLPSLQPIRDLTIATTKASKGATLEGIELHRIGEALAAARAPR